jgi:hypothetical protein
MFLLQFQIGQHFQFDWGEAEVQPGTIRKPEVAAMQGDPP